MNLSISEQRICDSVRNRIAKNRMIRSRTNAGLYGFFLISALLCFGLSLQSAGAGASASGFTQYVSLIMSDGSSLSGAWNSLFLSLVESLPILAIMSVLFTFTVAAYCMKKIVDGHFFSTFAAPRMTS